MSTKYKVQKVNTWGIWAFSNHSGTKSILDIYYICMYVGVGYNAIIDSALISISASPSVTPCHGHTKNRMQYYAIICNIQVWMHNYMKAFNSTREEKKLFWNKKGKNNTTTPLRKNEDKVIFCHLPPLFFSHYCNVIWFSIIFHFGLVWAAENPSWSLQSCIRTHILEEKQHFRSNDKCIALHLGFDGIH